MWERVRFVRYALRFERAFKTDEWTAVKACFHPDARYIVEGSDSEWDGESRGPDAIAAYFKRILDAMDRKFERRIPGVRGWPRVADGELRLLWKARYVAPGGEVVLNGESRCRFSDGKIIELRDLMNADECRAWAALIGAPVRPPKSS
jgi:ketosteroid isomerase-like protein